MTSIFLENSIHLTSLQYKGSGFPYTVKFLAAMANQTSLQFLRLEEENMDNDDLDEYDLEGIEILVDSLSKLGNLTDLHASEMFDCFSDLEVVRLASSLPKLEVWSTNGAGLTDAIWDAVVSLKSLRRLVFGAYTIFTVGGVLDFIEKLGPGNKGLFLDMRHSNRDFSWMNQKWIEERIAKRVGGEFDFNFQGGDYRQS